MNPKTSEENRQRATELVPSEDLERLVQYRLAKEFTWNYAEIRSHPIAFNRDMLTILKLEGEIQEKLMEEARQKAEAEAQRNR